MGIQARLLGAKALHVNAFGTSAKVRKHLRSGQFRKAAQLRTPSAVIDDCVDAQGAVSHLLGNASVQSAN